MSHKDTCTKTDCTVSHTGTCLDAYENLSECPNFILQEIKNSELVDTSIFGNGSSDPSTLMEQVDSSDALVRRFHIGTELGTSDAAELMRARYVHLVAILGAHNVGKTCFLCSLYLMASLGDLEPDYSFAGSLTLPGFEERARRLRRWPSGILPDKLADHTVFADPRSPSFVHLALGQENGTRTELLLTDLPGEWTTQLINQADAAAKFSFLKRADGIIIVIENQRLRSNSERNTEIQRTKWLLERLARDVAVDMDIPLVFVISKSDQGGMEVPKAVAKIEDYAIHLGFRPTTVMVSAFSKEPTLVKSGTGVMGAIRVVLNHQSPFVEKIEGISPPLARSFARFRQ